MKKEKWRQKLEQLILPAVTKVSMNVVSLKHSTYLYQKMC